jgi:hypothetical protein
MEEQLTAIFFDIDDFCKRFEPIWNKKLLRSGVKQRQRQGNMSLSEIMAILAMFHLSHYRTFKEFYQQQVSAYWRREFPHLLSYERFVWLKSTAIIPLCTFLNTKKGKTTGISYVDSTALPICHNRRIYRNKVFRGLAERGKTSVGWFYGFKLHLIINHVGEVISFALTRGNVDDRAPVEKLAKNLTGNLFGDKGYISKLLENLLFKNHVNLITKMKKNMKKKPLSKTNKFFLGKRGLVETVIDQLKNICQISHTRHRSPTNFVVNILGGLVAYAFKARKPSFHLPLSTALIQN